MVFEQLKRKGRKALAIVIVLTMTFSGMAVVYGEDASVPSSEPAMSQGLSDTIDGEGVTDSSGDPAAQSVEDGAVSPPAEESAVQSVQPAEKPVSQSMNEPAMGLRGGPSLFSLGEIGTYDSLTAGKDMLRPFTLLGYIDSNKMNLIEVSEVAEVYVLNDPVNNEFLGKGPWTSEMELVGNFVELWDTDGDQVADIVLYVPRNQSETYWDKDMDWLPGVGENTDPSVDDATGEAIFGAEYVLPMGERQLVGYGLGDWSGTTDFSNLENETYWPFIDFYNASSSETLTILPQYKSALQATGGTCGVTSAATVLEWFGVRGDLNEKDLAALRSNQTRWGGYTSLEALTSVFKNLADLGITDEWNLDSSLEDPYKLFDSDWVQETLAGGSPIMVGWESFGPHWQVIIGYDNMGTEDTLDDVLIMMDPYDSTDHKNDGYTIQSYERLAFGVGLREQMGTDEDPFFGTQYLVATPVGWSYTLASGEGIPDDPTNVGNFGDDQKIPYGDAADDIQSLYPKTPYIGSNGLAGAATGGYERSGDYDNSPYYKFFDFYNMKNSDSLVILEKFRTSQQVTEWSCGLSSILMVMDWFDMNDEGLTELDLAKMRQGGAPGATTVAGMEEVFEGLNKNHGGNWEWFTMRDLGDEDDVAELIPELLRNGIPMMVGWDEWGGHWQVIIGYDDMGTPETQDYVLIMADPYDTTDHNQDGYYLESFERLLYGWTARFDEYGAFIVAFPGEEKEDVETVVDKETTLTPDKDKETAGKIVTASTVKKDYTPKTGDESMGTFIALLMLVTASTVVVGTARKRMTGKEFE